jgi:hypothetical protein
MPTFGSIATPLFAILSGIAIGSYWPQPDTDMLSAVLMVALLLTLLNLYFFLRAIPVVPINFPFSTLEAWIGSRSPAELRRDVEPITSDASGPSGGRSFLRAIARYAGVYFFINVVIVSISVAVMYWLQ